MQVIICQLQCGIKRGLPAMQVFVASCLSMVRKKKASDPQGHTPPLAVIALFVLEGIVRRMLQCHPLSVCLLH